ncbi:MAG: hypothetical protein AAF092_06730 [Pseudomonadota bacterium]
MTQRAATEWEAPLTLYDSAHLKLVYYGPPLSRPDADPVVVVFGPFDYPRDAGQGWGTASFAKRGIAHVSVSHTKPDWHQNADFFPAMAAVHRAVGGRRPTVSYGFSMGGYGAVLGAKALGAVRAVAISPQVSIDPATARFERRFHAEWEAMGPWIHDLRTHMDHAREYIFAFDPLHRQDAKHESRFPRRRGSQRLLTHGAGHAGIQTLVGMRLQEELFGLLTLKRSAPELRRAYRAQRLKSFRYVRKLGHLLHEENHPAAPRFMETAREAGFYRLVRRWQKYYDG